MGMKRLAVSTTMVLIFGYSLAAWATWEDQDRFFKTYCADLNEHFKTQIVCQIDHASFDKAKIKPDFVESGVALPK